jgi:predicted RNase H-like HicB family nuclease
MHYSVFLEPINEPDFSGHYYARIPTLDLTTHGQGLEGALAAAQELVESWIAEKKTHGDFVPVESRSLITRIEVPDVLFRS